MFVTDPPDTSYPVLREIITALDAQSPCTLSFPMGCIPLPSLLQNISIPVLLKSFILKKSKKIKSIFYRDQYAHLSLSFLFSFVSCCA